MVAGLGLEAQFPATAPGHQENSGTTTFAAQLAARRLHDRDQEFTPSALFSIRALP
jgi:hypothetical protein